jgi:Kef-type K+ transport system membrane component KefB
VATAAAGFLLDWSPRAALIAGTALSTTSLAVVYAVLVERRLTDTSVGKLLMSATFAPGGRLSSSYTWCSTSTAH